MGIKDGFKNSFKKGFLSPFNVSKWIGTDNIKQSGRVVKDMYQDLYKENGKGAPKQESFDQAMKRLDLSESDIKKRMETSKKRIAIYLAFAFFDLVYMIYLFFIKQYGAGFLTIIILLLLLAYSFKEHFQYFQMKNRKLGCTFKEWYQGLFRGKSQ